MIPRRLHCLLLLVICVFVGVGPGCNRREQIESYSVPKILPIPSEPVADTGDTITAPQWTVPDGWKFIPGHDMRFASFDVSPEHPDVQLTVVPLDSGGGTLLDNVHRWQKQLGLQPSSTEDLKNIMTTADLSGTPAGLFDFTGCAPRRWQATGAHAGGDRAATHADVVLQAGRAD